VTTHTFFNDIVSLLGVIVPAFVTLVTMWWQLKKNINTTKESIKDVKENTLLKIDGMSKKSTAIGLARIDIERAERQMAVEEGELLAAVVLAIKSGQMNGNLDRAFMQYMEAKNKLMQEQDKHIDRMNKIYAEEEEAAEEQGKYGRIV